MKVFKVKVLLKPVVKVTGLSALESVQVDDLISTLKGEFCIHHAVQTKDEYVGYKQTIELVRCKDERGEPIDNSRG